MKFRSAIVGAALLLVLLNSTLLADQIVLKDGKAYSGKFIRGDSKIVEFGYLAELKVFKTSDVAQIVFKEPELGTASGSLKAAAPDTSRQTEPASADSAAASESAEQEEPVLEYATTAMTMPAGTPFKIRTTVGIDTDRNRVGDVFDAILDENLVYDNRIVVPRGVTIKGRIAYAKEAGRLTGQSQLILELTELVISASHTYCVRPIIPRLEPQGETGLRLPWEEAQHWELS